MNEITLARLLGVMVDRAGGMVEISEGELEKYVMRRAVRGRLDPDLDEFSSLRAFYLWLLAAFIAGVVATLLVQAAFSGDQSTERGTAASLTSSVDWLPVRAAHSRPDHMPEADELFGIREEPARASAHVARTDHLPASDPPGAHHEPRSHRDDPAAVLAAIDAAAAEFGREAERMRIVAFCESSWDPLAVGDAGTSFGLWQFQLATWRANVRRAGFEYSDVDVFDPVASSRVAAWAWAHGGELLWTCARSDASKRQGGTTP